MIITPLQNWVDLKTDCNLPRYQLEMLNKTLQIAQNSKYYKKMLPCKLDDLSELQHLPTIDAGILVKEGASLVCTPQHEISRIVTLKTSGTTGASKRVYFTAGDQELTIDYFANGLQTITQSGGVTAILLPCDTPGGVGQLIANALLRIPVTPVQCGPVFNISRHVNILLESGADSMIAAPVQALNIARYCSAKRIKLNLKSILLSTDNIPRITVSELKKHLSCEVYEHYGMTETGLGGAIDCKAHDGYHIRENDLLFEVLDENNRSVKDGEFGELAITTLTRCGMPLIRYKTGDISRIIPGICRCGSALKRISRIKARTGSDTHCENGTVLRLSEFDELLFAVPQISDFTVYANPECNQVDILLIGQESFGDINIDVIKNKLYESGVIKDVTVSLSVCVEKDFLRFTGKKRTIKNCL